MTSPWQGRVYSSSLETGMAVLFLVSTVGAHVQHRLTRCNIRLAQPFLSPINTDTPACHVILINALFTMYSGDCLTITEPRIMQCLGRSFCYWVTARALDVAHDRTPRCRLFISRSNYSVRSRALRTDCAWPRCRTLAISSAVAMRIKHTGAQPNFIP